MAIALVRSASSEMRKNEAASDIGLHVPAFEDAAAAILARVTSVAPSEASGSERQLSEILQQWTTFARYHDNGVYRDYKNFERALLVPADRADGFSEPSEGFATLQSLRNVDQSANIYLRTIRDKGAGSGDSN